MKTLSFIKFLNHLNLVDPDMTISIYGGQWMPCEAIDLVCMKDDPNDELFWKAEQIGKFHYKCVKA